MRKIITIMVMLTSFNLSASAQQVNVPAPQHATYLVNSDSTGLPIDVTYTVCSDVLERHPTCSKPKNISVYQYKPANILFENQGLILYIWNAKLASQAQADYSIEVGDFDGNLVTSSDCAATSRQFIVLDAHATNRVGCQAIHSGK